MLEGAKTIFAELMGWYVALFMVGARLWVIRAIPVRSVQMENLILWATLDVSFEPDLLTTECCGDFYHCCACQQNSLVSYQLKTWRSMKRDADEGHTFKDWGSLIKKKKDAVVQRISVSLFFPSWK